MPSLMCLDLSHNTRLEHIEGLEALSHLQRLFLHANATLCLVDALGTHDTHVCVYACMYEGMAIAECGMYVCMYVTR